MADPERRARSKGRRFNILSKHKRVEEPAPPIPDHRVSPIEDETPKVRTPAQNIWPGQISPAPMPAHENGMSPRSAISPQSPTPFDDLLEQEQESIELVAAIANEEPSYDLKPPPPSVSHSNIEALSERLFSSDHVDTILRNHISAARFKRFLSTYRPKYIPTLKRYADSRKAILAVEYANAVAEYNYPDDDDDQGFVAASLDRAFQAQMIQDVGGLLEEALPAYITHRMTQLVTDTLVKEITQNGAPILRELIPNLAEVYCITDPSLQDNPIVYASQEFYNVSQYGREYVIGRNCRFLQGPKTSNATIRRLIDALRSGTEVCETVLNYKRDGTPFMNLLLIAPLYDNKGQIRYFLGCQIDISPLIDGGRGLESFEHLLAQDRSESRFAGALSKDPKHALSQLSQMFNDDELSEVKYTTKSSNTSSSRLFIDSRGREPRRVLGADDVDQERPLWPHHSFGPSGRLPGVYQNYLLVRPYPSMRVTFTSPALRIPGLVQAKFLDRVGGPQHVREGILDAFAHGTGVTAKIQWLTTSLENASGQGRHRTESKPRWIHCTPLLGSDEKVGVWMVVMVEQEEVTGSLRRPMPGGSQDGIHQFGTVHSSVRSGKTTSTRVTRNNLYADYLNDGKPRDDSAHAEGLITDDHFNGFDQ